MDYNARNAPLVKGGRLARSQTATSPNTESILSKVVDIYCDGTRMSATLWLPDDGTSAEKPALLLMHGWGGLRDHLDMSYAKKFCKAGFVVLTFDYRGWGDSDGVILPAEGPTPLLKVIDPNWQLRDIATCLDYLTGGGVEGVDTTRVGIWGSSMGGAHAITVGGTDTTGRVKCIVSQVGMMTTSDLLRHAGVDIGSVAQQASQIAAGEATSRFTWNLPELDGQVNVARMRDYVAKEYAKNVQVPTLVLDAENEVSAPRMYMDL
jgi:dienelactone hydrolase